MSAAAMIDLEDPRAMAQVREISAAVLAALPLKCSTGVLLASLASVTGAAIQFSAESENVQRDLVQLHDKCLRKMLALDTH